MLSRYLGRFLVDLKKIKQIGTHSELDSDSDLLQIAMDSDPKMYRFGCLTLLFATNFNPQRNVAVLASFLSKILDRGYVALQIGSDFDNYEL
jgi:hypothetical protein